MIKYEVTSDNITTIILNETNFADENFIETHTFNITGGIWIYNKKHYENEVYIIIYKYNSKVTYITNTTYIFENDFELVPSLHEVYIISNNTVYNLDNLKFIVYNDTYRKYFIRNFNGYYINDTKNNSDITKGSSLYVCYDNKCLLLHTFNEIIFDISHETYDISNEFDSIFNVLLMKHL